MGGESYVASHCDSKSCTSSYAVEASNYWLVAAFADCEWEVADPAEVFHQGLSFRANSTVWFVAIWREVEAGAEGVAATGDCKYLDVIVCCCLVDCADEVPCEGLRESVLFLGPVELDGSNVLVICDVEFWVHIPAVLALKQQRHCQRRGLIVWVGLLYAES